jgi:hypothetical protein
MRQQPGDNNCSRVLSQQVKPARLLSGFHYLWFDAPKLKAMGANRLFDRIAREIKGGSALRADDSDLSPGPKLVRQLTARRVPGERP